MVFVQIVRGEIYDLDFGKLPGGMKDLRPALIVQNDIGNQFAPYTIVAAIHHETGKQLPVTVSVEKGVGGLSRNSVVDCSHVATVPKKFLLRKRGSLPAQIMEKVDTALRISLEL